MINLEQWLTRPLRLKSNRVWRTYRGGKLIEQWLGNEDGVDNQFPEEWIGSVVMARNPGREQLKEGLSIAVLPNGTEVTLKELIEADPIGFLGKEHAAQFGIHTGVLVKILDSAERLTIQVHPDRITAKKLFSSDYGKTEAWYILDGREIDGERPYILYGFKAGMTKEKWEKLFWAQDMEGMIQSLNKIYIEKGQIFLVQGGMPHAIGPGCFLVEIQEPTDYTIRVERTTPSGQVIPDASCHQGIGFTQMFDCFHYETYTEDEVLRNWCLQPTVVQDCESGKESTLISYDQIPYFRMNSLEIRTSLELSRTTSFSTIVVASGAGLLRWTNEELSVSQGDQLFLPAGLEDIHCLNKGADPLHLVQCFPPKASE